MVVGAGLTGIWTALFLKELDPSTEVVVVEQGVAAYGASGRNAGMLSETVDHSHGLAIQHFGAAEARRLAALGEQNVAEMLAFLSESEASRATTSPPADSWWRSRRRNWRRRDAPSRPPAHSASRRFASSMAPVRGQR